jgi:RNA polymerase sigma-70 factor (ECF subfamily)
MSGKFFGVGTHDEVVVPQATQRSVELPPQPSDFDGIYRAWFYRVERWLVALGAPDSELEDWTQEVFVVVRRKLVDFDGQNLTGWLYKIATRTASDFRRRAWFRRLIFRAPAGELDELVEQRDGPAALLEQKEDRRLLLDMLGRIEERRRMVLVLSDMEGLSGEEIAAVTGTKVATVWTRLHRARKEFDALVAEQEHQ